MTLNEAINSGKAFTRPALQDLFGFFTSDDIGVDVVLSASDITATDYVLEPSEVLVTRTSLAEAWDSVARQFQNVKDSRESKLFSALQSKLMGE